MDFDYIIQPPRRFTFQYPRLRKWVEGNCKGKVLNLFAGKTKLNVDEIRVDVNPEMKADYYQDAYEFVKNWNGEKFDTVILDPPYNVRKAREKYNGRFIGKFTKLKRILPRILSPNAIIISLGYDSSGMGRGFKKKKICLVNHSGDHNDTIVLIEERIGDVGKWLK